MQGIIGAIFSSLGFGSANIVIKKSLENVSIPKTLFMSFFSGALSLLLYLFITNSFKTLGGNELLLIPVMAIGEIILYLLLYKSFSSADVTVATSILGVYPILTTIGSIFFFGAEVGILEWMFIVVMILGALMITIDWVGVFKNGFDKNDLTKGLIWIFLCTIAHAIYFPALGAFTASGDLFPKLFYIKIVASIIVFIGVIVLTKKTPIPEKSKIPALSLLGVLEVIGWIAFSYAVANDITQVGIITAALNLGSLVTAVLAFFILKEKLKPFQYVGIIVLFIGLTLLGISQSQ